MKITNVDLKPYRLKYREKFKIASGHLDHAPVVYMLVHTDEGVTGLGYASGSAPFYCGETQESITAAVKGIMEPVIKGRDPFDIELMMTEIENGLRLNLRAKAGLEIALYDLVGKILDLPLYKLWGGLCRREITVTRMLGIGSPEGVASKAAELMNKGFKSFKIKIGKDPKGDIDRVRAVREAVGPDVILCADANQGYTVKDAIRTIRGIEQYEICYVEQPVPADDLDGLALIRKSVAVPIQADESVRSLSDALNLIKKEAADIISLKPSEIGGFRKIRKVLAICEAANVQCLIGPAPGSSFLDAANTHFAASCPLIGLPCELGEFLRMQNDPVSGLKIEGGMAHVPEGPGLGIHLDLSAFA